MPAPPQIFSCSAFQGYRGGARTPSGRPGSGSNSPSSRYGNERSAALASRKSLVPRLAMIVDVGGLRLGAVGERTQQVEYLLVTVFRHQPLDVVSPAAPAKLTNDRQRRIAYVRQSEGVLWHQAKASASI